MKITKTKSINRFGDQNLKKVKTEIPLNKKVSKAQEIYKDTVDNKKSKGQHIDYFA